MKRRSTVVAALVAGMTSLAQAQTAPAPAAPAEAAPALAGNAEAGANVFKKCSACHRVGENARNAVGPQLNGVVGRAAASLPDYNYSPAMKAAGIVWDEPTLASYLKNPKAVVPGTKMAFVGLKSDQETADVVTYLKQFGPNGAKAP